MRLRRSAIGKLSGPRGPNPVVRVEPFFTTKEVGHGTGLGLSISRGLAESNGGRLYLDESKGETCLVVQFAARKPRAISPGKRKKTPAKKR